MADLPSVGIRERRSGVIIAGHDTAADVIHVNVDDLDDDSAGVHDFDDHIAGVHHVDDDVAHVHELDDDIADLHDLDDNVADVYYVHHVHDDLADVHDLDDDIAHVHDVHDVEYVDDDLVDHVNPTAAVQRDVPADRRRAELLRQQESQ